MLSLLYDMAVPMQSNTPVIFGCAFCGLMRPPVNRTRHINEPAHSRAGSRH